MLPRGIDELNIAILTLEMAETNVADNPD